MLQTQPPAGAEPSRVPSARGSRFPLPRRRLLRALPSLSRLHCARPWPPPRASPPLRSGCVEASRGLAARPCPSAPATLLRPSGSRLVALPQPRPGQAVPSLGRWLQRSLSSRSGRTPAMGVTASCHLRSVALLLRTPQARQKRTRSSDVARVPGSAQPVWLQPAECRRLVGQCPGGGRLLCPQQPRPRSAGKLQTQVCEQRAGWGRACSGAREGKGAPPELRVKGKMLWGTRRRAGMLSQPGATESPRGMDLFKTIFSPLAEDVGKTLKNFDHQLLLPTLCGGFSLLPCPDACRDELGCSPSPFTPRSPRGTGTFGGHPVFLPTGTAPDVLQFPTAFDILQLSSCGAAAPSACRGCPGSSPATQTRPVDSGCPRG